MNTKQVCLDSLTANGCRKLGVNKWSDADHEFRIVKSGEGYDIKATRTSPWLGMNVEMRNALRPMFLASQGR